MEIEKNQSKCGIYMWEALFGSRVGWKYIGKTKNDFIERYRGHKSALTNKKHHSPKLQNYYDKYGFNGLDFQITFECPKKELNFWEKFWIKCFDSYYHGFNCTFGGDDELGKNYRTKPCSFQNIKTKEIVKVNSITEFCDKYDLRHNSVASVVRGEMNYIYDWFCLENKWRPKYYTVVDPYGKEYEIAYVKIWDFCKEMNISNPNSFCRMVNGGVKSYKLWHLKDKPVTYYSSYKLIHQSSGEVVEGVNISSFCKIRNLKRLQILRVVNEQLRMSDGWLKYKEGMVENPYLRYVYKFVSPDNKIYGTDNLNEFAKRFGLHRVYFSKLWKEEKPYYKGWTKYKE